MAKGRSCCCSGLSKGWWWFLTLVGLPFLYALMLVTKWEFIENDIQTRAIQKLNNDGINWTTVDLNGRGRDVLLTGTTITNTDRDNAIQTVLGVDGVRKVNSDIKIEPLRERALTASYTHKDGILVIEGVLSSQDQVDAILKLLADKIGLDKIDNKLTVSNKFSSKGGIITLAGSVLTEDTRSDISSAIQAGSNALGLSLTNNLKIDIEAVKAIAKTKRIAAEKAEAEKLAAEKAEAKRIAAEKAEVKRLAMEQAEAKRLATKKAEAEKLVAEKVKATEIAAQVHACQTKLNNTMSGKTILFHTNKANIKKSSFALLQQIATVITECRTALPNAKIMVSGHTDNRGSKAYNLTLSQRRANAVKTYLSSIGVNSAIITSKGFGESEPVASNDTIEGRAQNRRITFSVK
jgi:outer membrane protein OmpA-like peptidoglycan-associated protein